MNKEITHKDLIDIEAISKEEYDIYLDFFSEGSRELRNCLELMWSKELFTSASCKGHDLVEKEYIFEDKTYYIISPYAYINMKPNKPILEYLSKELIIDPYIHFSRENNRDSIYIYGRDRLKKIDKLNDDIKSGVKDNKELLKIFTNKWISREIIHNAYREFYYDNNFYFEEIARIEEINYLLISSNDENYKESLSEEYNKILKKIRKRNMLK